MSWFLRRKDKRKSNKSRTTGGAYGTKRSLLPVTLKVLFVLAAIAALLYLVTYGEHRLQQWAKQRYPVASTYEHVMLVNPPDWMTPATELEIRKTVAEHLTDDPYDVVSLRKAADALREVPWVQAVHQVRRSANDRVEVHADYRKPFAVIEARDGYHLVDRYAVTLPGLYQRHHIDALPLLMLTGVRNSPPGHAGRQWRGREVQAGLEMVELLEPQSYVDQIRAIDVSQRDRDDRVRVRLLTHHGEVHWGYPPSAMQAVEPTPTEKLRRLEQLSALSEYDGQIDAGGRIVEIFGPQIMVLEQN